MNVVNEVRTRRLHQLIATLAVALLLALVAPAAVKAGDRTPDLGGCEELAVPKGHKLAAHLYAVGVQIYRWNGSSWEFAGPEALLFADEGGNGVVGIHYGGPTWESNSGSKVVGTLVHPCPVDPDSIAWLKLAAVSSTGPGIFHGVTFIQRLNTFGGIAPSEPGDFVGEETRVPYTAEYFFYRAK